MEKTGYSVIAGRPAARKFKETHRTAPQVSFARILEVLGAITFAVILMSLYGCDGEFERLQAQAEFNQKMARATTPHKGELITVKQISEGHYIVRRYNRGLKETYVVAREEAE